MAKLELQNIQETGKVWYKSKSVWLGIATLASGVFSAVAELLPLLSLTIPALTYSLLLFSFGVVAIALRLLTEGPILKEKKDVEG